MARTELPPFSRDAESLVIGGVYEHYKGFRYKVLALARHSETLEELVIYQALYGAGGAWARPVGMFVETLTVEGTSQPRFRLV